MEEEIATHSVFLPGKSHGLKSPWGHKELDTTEHPCRVLHPAKLSFKCENFFKKTLLDMQDLKQFTYHIPFLGKSLDETNQKEDVGYWKQETPYRKKAKDSSRTAINRIPRW